ncbi:MAG: hypothetical protein KAV87_36145 [Desulfobacteraceae bacterium]|nr:hypothetical protein [Desulfobacteraceae bacterium]
MKLICPSCGAVHSTDAWRNDPVIRQCLKMTGDFPYDISSRCFAYLALFRPQEKSLQWKKVLRLLSELAVLTDHAHIQWQKKPARPSSAKAWGLAMEQICENPPKHLPLKSHGYLNAIAYDIADDMDRQGEAKRNQAERSGSFHGDRESPSADEMKGIKDQIGKIFGHS